MKKKNIQLHKAFTLVETLVAISILMLAILGPLTIASAGLRNSAYARDQITAFYLAQEGIEFVRYVRDDNYLNNQVSGGGLDWLEGLESCMQETMSDYGCAVDIPVWFDDGDLNDNVVLDCTNEECANESMSFDPTTGRYTYVTTADSLTAPYRRIVTIEEITGTQQARVVSTVTWETRGGGEKQVTLTEYISNLYNQ